MGKPANAEREQAIYDFVVAYKAGNDGNSPTYREICDGTGVPTNSMVSFYLRRLEAQGRLTVSDFSSRHISITGGRWMPPGSGD